MARILFVIDDDLKSYYEDVARKLSVEKKKNISLSKLVRISLKKAFGVPIKEKAND